MTVISWQEREPYVQSTNLIVSLLMRYPELATVSLYPQERSLHFLFILKHTLPAEECEEVKNKIKEGWEVFWQLTNVKPELAEIVFTCDQDLTFIEIKRDVETITLSEISYMIVFLQERFENILCQEQPEQTEFSGYNDDNWTEELIEFLLEDLRDIKPEKNLIGFREEGRVFVYRT